MQNISKNLKQITMKKIEKYVVFKYEDEFGFHYMKMDKLPGEGPTYMEPISFEKKINPNCTPGASTRSVCPGQPQQEEHIYCSGGLPPHQVNIFH